MENFRQMLKKSLVYLVNWGDGQTSTHALSIEVASSYHSCVVHSFVVDGRSNAIVVAWFGDLV